MAEHLAFDADNLFHIAARERLDIGAIGKFGIGHDGGRVGVHQHHLVSLLLESLAGLRTRVVELGRLADNNRTRPDYKNFLNVISSWHLFVDSPTSALHRKNVQVNWRSGITANHYG